MRGAKPLGQAANGTRRVARLTRRVSATAAAVDDGRHNRSDGGGRQGSTDHKGDGGRTEALVYKAEQDRNEALAVLRNQCQALVVDGKEVPIMPTPKPLWPLGSPAVTSLQHGLEVILMTCGLAALAPTAERGWRTDLVTLDDGPPKFVWYNAGSKGTIVTNSEVYAAELERIKALGKANEWIEKVVTVEHSLHAFACM